MDSPLTFSPPEIDLASLIHRFFKALRRLWPAVIALILVFSLSGYVNARRNFRPMYECNALFSVGSDLTGGDVFTNNYYYDTVTAQQVAATFPYLLTTDFMRDLISAQLENGIINGSIQASAIAETNLVELSVTSRNPQDAYNLLHAVLAAYPRAAVYMVDNPMLYMREEPVLPTEPINHFSAGDAVSSGAIKGALLGFGLLLGYALLTMTVSSSKELNKLINLPILASFPLIRQKKRRHARDVLISAVDNQSFAEALRGLRTKVRKKLAQSGGQVVLLTSTIPGEGKTTASVNLAQSLASEGHRVILLDADFRNQSISRIFLGGETSECLIELLKNPTQPLDSYLKTTPDPNLVYISGASTQKRHYSIDGKALRSLLIRLRREFDYVVVDTPPCNVVSDTSLLCRYADAVLYVVKLDYANRLQILDGVTRLHQDGVPLIGCVINGAVPRHNRYGYSYGYGYGKKYGYGKNYSSGFSSASQMT